MNAAVYLLANANQTHDSLDRFHALIQKLTPLGQFLTYEENAEWLSCYAQDAQSLKTLLPLLVFRPHSLLCIQPAVQTCYQAKIPVQIRGGGTSLAGASLVSPGGLILLTNHLTKILDYDPDKGIIKVEPGLTCSQLNHYVQKNGWEFPLEMSTNGVASLGGCLSCQAKGYHQTDLNLYQAVRKVLLVDGTGEIREVSGYLVDGAEGMFGVIIEIEIQLSRIPEVRMTLEGVIAWHEIMQNIDQLKKQQSLQSLGWNKQIVQFRLVGEAWRIDSTANLIKSLFSAQKLKSSTSQLFTFSTKKRRPVILNCTVPVKFLDEAMNNLHHLANSLEIEIQFYAEVLSGTLYIQLASQCSVYVFGQLLENFMVLAIEIVGKLNGRFFSSQTIGKLWRPYLTPFLSEQELQFLKHFKQLFDPAHLFGRDHFFPEAGKCLVRTSYE